MEESSAEKSGHWMDDLKERFRRFYMDEFIKQVARGDPELARAQIQGFKRIDNDHSQKFRADGKFNCCHVVCSYLFICFMTSTEMIQDWYVQGCSEKCLTSVLGIRANRYRRLKRIQDVFGSRESDPDEEINDHSHVVADFHV